MLSFALLDKFLSNEKTKEEEKSEDQKYADKLTCKRCNRQLLTIDNINGHEVCKGCGYIANEILISDRPELKFTSNGDGKLQHENNFNTLLPKSSMMTFISGNKYNSIQRLHLWHRMPSDERSLWEVFKIIDKITYGSGINKSVLNEAKLYYKSLCEDNTNSSLTRGIVRKGLIAACIYVSCKNNKRDRTADEIAKMCGISTSDVTKGVKKFVEIEKNRNIKFNKNVNNIHVYIHKYARELNIDNYNESIMHLIYERAKKIRVIKNNTTPTICSGILFLCIKHFGLEIKKKELIGAINITEVTLNKIYAFFQGYEKVLFIGL